MTWRLDLTPGDADHDRHKRVGTALTPSAFGYESYLATEGIVEALNTALALGKPLLVSGAPGSGKTRLAYWAAWRLGLMRDGGASGPYGDPEPEVFRFDVKSTSKGEDLLYHYDAIGHFRASSVTGKGGPDTIPVQDFIELRELGWGIALASGLDGATSNLQMRDFLMDKLPFDSPRMSVVLVDEIDKAPKDVPNDLLRAFDEMSFKIPELGRSAEIRGSRAIRPLVIVTTNNERALPEAFLRRCCFLHIDFPGVEQMRKIVASQLREGWSDSTLAGDAIRLVLALRTPDFPVRKPPGLSDLLDYLLSLRSRGARPDDRLRSLPYARAEAATVLGKDKDDPALIEGAFNKIAAER